MSLYDAFNPGGGQGGRFIDWGLEISLVDEEALNELTPSGTGDAAISRVAQTIDNQTEPLGFGTFEQGGWPLDGGRVIPPRVTELPDAQIGWLSAVLSGADGTFAAPPVYQVATQQEYNHIAVTFDWGAVPAIDFTVRWYGGNTLLREHAVTGNADAITPINIAVAGVTRIAATVTRVAPYHRARLIEFVPGALIQYNRHNARELRITEGVDPLSERVVTKTLAVQADNFASQFNIFSPDGIYEFFRDRMRMTASIKAQTDGQWLTVPMGDFFLSRPQLSGNTNVLDLSATGRLGALMDTEYTKGVYRTGTLAGFVDEVAADAGVTVIYPASFSGITLAAYIATMSHARAFHLIAQATGTLLIERRDGSIEFYAPSGAPAIKLSADDYKSENGLAVHDDTIKNTVTIEHISLSPEAPSELARMPASGTITAARYYADNAEITTTGGVYRPRYDPATNITAAITGGELVVTGQRIVITKGAVTVERKRESEPNYLYDAVKGNVFVTQSAAPALAQLYLERLAVKRRLVKLVYRGYPYLLMGDIASFLSAVGETQPFYLYKNALTLSGGMSGTLEAREL